jgi:hypothetical protein
MIKIDVDVLSETISNFFKDIEKRVSVLEKKVRDMDLSPLAREIKKDIDKLYEK